jgi:hypothetical protein
VKKKTDATKEKLNDKMKENTDILKEKTWWKKKPKRRRKPRLQGTRPKRNKR